MNNRPLIDAFKAKYHLKHDLAVAAVLDGARPSISDWTSAWPAFSPRATATQ
jgi:hypothetical protein